MADKEISTKRPKGPTTDRADAAKSAETLARLALEQQGKPVGTTSLLEESSKIDQRSSAEKRQES